MSSRTGALISLIYQRARSFSFWPIRRAFCADPFSSTRNRAPRDGLGKPFSFWPIRRAFRINAFCPLPNRVQLGDPRVAAFSVAWLWEPVSLPLWAVFAILALAVVAVILFRRRQSRSRRELVENNKALRTQNTRLEESTLYVREARKMRNAAPQKTGMASIAADVLNNIGNALNGVHVSANMIEQEIQNLRLDFLTKLTALIGEREAALSKKSGPDPSGEMILPALTRWKDRLEKNQSRALAELKKLNECVFQINEIVAAQKKYVTVDRKPEWTDVKQLIEDVLRIQTTLINELRIQIVKDFKTAPEIKCSRVKLLQIVNHIVKNACETLMVGADMDNRLLVLRLRHEKEYLRLEIEDNGNGIQKDQLTAIFSPGYSTKSAGHGSGLHYCANAIAEMGGMIGVKSKGSGTGATFILEIPVNPEKTEGHAEPSLSEALPE